MPTEVLGLDLGTSSLKLVALSKSGEGFQVQGVSITTNPIGRISTSSSEEKVRLITALQSLGKAIHSSTASVRIGLAESQVFTRVIRIPVLSEAELGSAIRWEAEQHIPIPISDVYLDYVVLYRPSKSATDSTMEVLLVAARRTAVDDLVSMAELASFDIIGVETGLLGAVRGLTGPSDPPTLLMHIGAVSTDFAVISDGRIILTYSIPTAGVALTRAIEEGLGLSFVQAEQYKRAYGINEQLLEGKVRAVLLPIFRSLMAEARKTMNSFESTRREKKIERVVLSGGGALLPGISGEVASQLGISEVILGNPFASLSVKEGIKLPAEFPVYSPVVGLAKGAS